jgi:hypothetical protein
MTRVRAIVSVIAVLAGVGQSGGCVSHRLDCDPESRPRCEALFGPCEAVPAVCVEIPPGASGTLVEIISSPTAAAVYVDGEYVGRTPLSRYLWFSSLTRSVTVAAEPLYPGQARQEQRLRVPHLPRRLTFFMNNPAMASPPEDPNR